MYRVTLMSGMFERQAFDFSCFEDAATFAEWLLDQHSPKEDDTEEDFAVKLKKIKE